MSAGDDCTDCGCSVRRKVMRHAVRSALTMFALAVAIAMAWGAYLLPPRFIVAVLAIAVVIIAVSGVWLVFGQLVDEWIPPKR